MTPNLLRDGELQIDDGEAGRAIREIIRAVRSINFGSVEIVIHDSRIVQIERKEKLRLDRR
jgi:hypothetical protein